MNTGDYFFSEYLKEYLLNKVSSERFDIIIRLFNTLDSINKLMSSTYFLDITELEGDLIDISESDETLGDDVIIVMEKVILSNVMDYLEHIGIFLNSDTTFKLLADVINGLNTIFTIAPEMTYEIESVISDDERDINNKLAYMLSLYTVSNEHQYFEIIEDVDIDFYTRLSMAIDIKKEMIVLDNDDMSIVNFITNINNSYNDTYIVSTLRKEGYHDQAVIEYLENMYRIVNTATDVTLAAMEVAATFYIGIDSRYAMFDYYDLYFNQDAVVNANLDKPVFLNKINQFMIEIDNKV